MENVSSEDYWKCDICNATCKKKNRGNHSRKHEHRCGIGCYGLNGHLHDSERQDDVLIWIISNQKK